MLKLFVEITLAIFLHPVAYILCVINIVTRKDLSGVWKLIWILVTFFWGVGPILYLIFGGGTFWQLERDRSATRALVLGLLSLLFGILSPFAIWAGARSIYRIRTGPGNLTGEGSAWIGVVAGFISLAFTVAGVAYWFLAS